jgi:hypothetical protein
VVALDEKLEQIAQQDEKDRQDQCQVDVPEDEEQDPIGDQLGGQIAAALSQVVHERQRRQKHCQTPDDPTGVFAVAAEQVA